jgi:hypothetical protein
MNSRQLKSILDSARLHNIGITGKFGLRAIGNNKVLYKTQKLRMWCNSRVDVSKFLGSLESEMDYEISSNSPKVYGLYMGFPIELDFSKDGPKDLPKKYSGIFFLKTEQNKPAIDDFFGEKEEIYHNDEE